jgi:hypothetical protein
MNSSTQVNVDLVHSGLAYEMRFSGTNSSPLNNLPKVGDPIILLAESDNQFDQTAVAIYNQLGFLGYINPTENKGLFEYLEEGKPYFAQLLLIAELADSHNIKYGILVYATDLIPGCKEVLRVPTRG